MLALFKDLPSLDVTTRHAHAPVPQASVGPQPLSQTLTLMFDYQ